MQLIGQPIKHVTFGKGVVTDWNGNVITVCFSAGEKKFIYPDAFSNFLILKNADAQKKVQHLLDVREEERETELKELQAQQEMEHMLENLKLSPQSQAVFHIDAEAHEILQPGDIPDYSGKIRGRISDLQAERTASDGIWPGRFDLKNVTGYPEKLKKNVAKNVADLLTKVRKNVTL